MQDLLANGQAAIYRPGLKKIDFVNAPEFQRALDAKRAETPWLVLNLEEVRFIDSSGLGRIVAALRACRAQGGEMVIASVQPTVKTLFDLVHLTDIVEIYADQDEALSFLAQSAEKR